VTEPIDIRPHDLDIVRSILKAALPPGAKVWVFGSRATWTTKDSSDLDLAIAAFRAIYPPYAPARGMAEYIRLNWHRYSQAGSP
jgi:predicted nucleotidyltransferase